MTKRQDRLADAGEGEAGLGQGADRLPFGHAVGGENIGQQALGQRQVAHGLIEIDQPGARVEPDVRASIIVNRLRVERRRQQVEQRRLAGAVDAEQGDPVSSRHGEAIDPQQRPRAIRRGHDEVGQAQSDLGVHLTIAKFQSPLPALIDLGLGRLDLGDAALGGLLALVEVRVLYAPDVVASSHRLQALDLTLLHLPTHGGGGVTPQQFLSGLGEGNLEDVGAVVAQEHRPGADPVEKLPIVGHDQHRHGHVVRQPALKDVDVADIQVVSRLVEDQDIRLLQPGGAGD